MNLYLARGRVECCYIQMTVEEMRVALKKGSLNCPNVTLQIRYSQAIKKQMMFQLDSILICKMRWRQSTWRKDRRWRRHLWSPTKKSFGNNKSWLSKHRKRRMLSRQKTLRRLLNWRNRLNGKRKKRSNSWRMSKVRKKVNMKRN